MVTKINVLLEMMELGETYRVNFKATDGLEEQRAVVVTCFFVTIRVFISPQYHFMNDSRAKYQLLARENT